MQFAAAHAHEQRKKTWKLHENLKVYSSGDYTFACVCVYEIKKDWDEAL